MADARHKCLRARARPCSTCRRNSSSFLRIAFKLQSAYLDQRINPCVAHLGKGSKTGLYQLVFAPEPSPSGMYSAQRIFHSGESPASRSRNRSKRFRRPWWSSPVMSNLSGVPSALVQFLDDDPPCMVLKWNLTPCHSRFFWALNERSRCASLNPSTVADSLRQPAVRTLRMVTWCTLLFGGVQKPTPQESHIAGVWTHVGFSGAASLKYGMSRSAVTSISRRATKNKTGVLFCRRGPPIAFLGIEA